MNDLSSKIVADPGRSPGRFTTAEFQRMCDVDAFSGMSVELVDGEIERLNQPKNPHSRRQAQLLILLAEVCPAALLRVEVGIELDETTVLGCDVAVLRVPVDGRDWLEPSDFALVIEVAVSSLARDLGLKLARYAAAGVERYWVVDDAAAAIHVYGRPVGGEYQDKAVVRFGEPLSVSGTDTTIIID
ncbi:Uma2 family endonuclease [uncultured Sphingomonas sp.]|uniref:Uma2 family endonuclease n=1 Tax=uncultured Sphingomonas sp. TaxID=158754 RepID=UPI0035CB6CD1